MQPASPPAVSPPVPWYTSYMKTYRLGEGEPQEVIPTPFDERYPEDGRYLGRCPHGKLFKMHDSIVPRDLARLGGRCHCEPDGGGQIKFHREGWV